MNYALILTAFLATAVEAVEGATYALAAAVLGGWRAAIGGVVSALLALAAIVAVALPIMHLIPLTPLRLVVGGVSAYYGARWLAKAVEREAGTRAKHDEAATFDTLVHLNRNRGAFSMAFGGTIMEGTEIVVIVLAMSSGGGMAPVVGALAAVGLVALAAAVLRHPLARVPENMFKLVVGGFLTTFGLYWLGEAAGIGWNGMLALLPPLTVLGAAGTYYWQIAVPCHCDDCKEVARIASTGWL